MRGKVVPLGSKAVTAYYAALVVLSGLFVAFLGGVMWSISRLPPCTTISKDICGVNDWSIAGLAATILAVAATVLAFLGAFAVAVFWRDLDTKVKAQVDELTEKRIQLISFNLQTLLQADVDRRLKILENKFEQRFLEIDEENKRLWKEQHDLKKHVDGQDYVLLGGVVSQYPWLLEAWAKEWTDKPSLIPIAYSLAARYTRVVDVFLDDPVQQQEHLKEISAPFSNPEDYLQAAERWANQIQSQQEKINALDAIAERQRSIAAWRGSRQP